jgi:hypothetical protein
VKRAAAFGILLVALAACQGSIGSTPPVAAPQVGANPQGQVAGVGGPGASRAKTAEGTVKYSKDMAAISFPIAEGYGARVVIASSPSPSASPSSSAKASGGASPSASVSASASASASASPSVSPSGKTTPSPQPTKKASVPLITLKLSVYPEDVPLGPTPDPEASPEPTPIQDRSAIVRAYFKAPGALKLPSLDAVKFTVPLDEIVTGRGFSIAFYMIPDKMAVSQPLLGGHKDGTMRIAYTTAAIVDAKTGVIEAGPGFDPITISANTAYAAVLYGDPEAIAGPGPNGQNTQFGRPSPLPFGVTPSPTPYGMTPSPTPYGYTPTPLPQLPGFGH